MHASEHELALYAGGELNWFERWSLKRHLNTCSQCEETVGQFRTDRKCAKGRFGHLPNLDWNSLEAEMTGNIRVGLAAGEVVAQPVAGYSWRPAMVLTCAFSLVMAAWFVLQPKPEEPIAQESSVESTRDGVEFNGEGRSVALRTTGQMEVISVRLVGSVGSRSVDSKTGQVTINHVYVQ